MLAVGQVQSGKTLSYEGLICLARDNGIPLVVVISGISNPLLEQGAGRLDEDLELAAPGAWFFRTNPSLDDEGDVDAFKGVVADWQDAWVPASARRTIVVTVLKHHGRLGALRSLLDEVGWGERPVLIIDDEADQASLNARIRRNEESTTYSRLLELRQSFDRFGYAQYTATPQAPLLISIGDVLSPRTVRVLKPGSGYVGGKVFFGDPDSKLVRTIPDGDLSALEEGAIDPPKSLIEALQVYLLGLAWSVSSGSLEPRSMLIHPSQGRDPHNAFHLWTRAYVRRVESKADLARNSLDSRADLVREFEAAWRDLKVSESNILPLEELLGILPSVLRRTTVMKMNASTGSTPRVPWRDFRGFILVGGQALDRGFTVKGLTVTYMPRGIGTGNADTIQQRARFFGYKREYLGLCRVYLEATTRYAFEAYVEHEEDVRQKLALLSSEGHDLRRWRRLFVLDPLLQPTRASVRPVGAQRSRRKAHWYSLAVPMETNALPELAGVDLIRGAFSVEASDESRPVGMGTILASDLAEFLSSLVPEGEADSLSLTAMTAQLQVAAVNRPGVSVDVFRMRPGRVSRREANALGRVDQLFQGRSKGGSAAAYRGDRQMHSKGLTLQIHRVVAVRPDGTEIEGWLPALWVPEEFAEDWFLQDVS
ncbi:Z1 domain-containing protein [Curtobacterium sp. MCLR17_039]|uniref:Z1 domain-containing protein n=1 Tax=Curtobacterium sp. MCLR17_039 TaxID=2175624 RepID=UPI0015E8E9F7|nr:Z1 domain-containing protein [Curtobacterium sp. MCLR17_039]